MSRRITPTEALQIFNNMPLAELGALALRAKKEVSGNVVFYNRNIHIEPTNICLFRCKFCSYRKVTGDPMAWYHSLEEVEKIAKDQQGKGVTEVHIVGGVHPDHNFEHYIQMISAVKRQLPEVAVKAYTAVELAYIIQRAGLSLLDGLKRLKEAGLAAIPGGGAEIFAPRVREIICPEKASAELWLETHETAHRLGIPTNATMLYGHIETPEEMVDHLARLRELQDKTGGFDAFIPLKFKRQNNDLGEIVTNEANITTDMRVVAVARLFLDNFPHIKAYWPMLGVPTTQLAIQFGADDIDGTIDDTTKIYSMAGAEIEKPALTTQKMRQLILEAGLEPVERDTFYNPIG